MNAMEFMRLREDGRDVDDKRSERDDERKLVFPNADVIIPAADECTRATIHLQQSVDSVGPPTQPLRSERNRDQVLSRTKKMQSLMIMMPTSLNTDERSKVAYRAWTRSRITSYQVLEPLTYTSWYCLFIHLAAVL